MASIDVVVPCYQYGRFLKEAVDSILTQDVNDLRVLIVDNASTDNSAEIAQEFARTDPRVETHLRKKNLGPHASYNDGIDWADSDYFLLLDADDVAAPGALARAIRLMEKNPNVSLTYGAPLFLTPGVTLADLEFTPASEDGEWSIKKGQDFIRGFCRHTANDVNPPTVIRRTSAQKAAGHYREALPYSDDFELWLRIAMLGDVGFTSATQAAYRIHPHQATSAYRKNPVNEFTARQDAIESFLAHEGDVLPDREELLSATRRSVEDLAYISAISHFMRGYPTQARSLMSLANRNAYWGMRLPPMQTMLRHRHHAMARAKEIFSEIKTSRSARSASGQAPGPNA